MSRLLRIFTLALLLPALAHADLQVVIVEGLGGEADYEDQFEEQVATIELASADLTSADRIRVFRSGEFVRQDVLDHFEQLRGELTANDRLVLFLIGHGSYDDHEYKFNIAGPDLTDTDLFDLLDGATAGNLLVVNTSSSSGAIHDRLKGDNRTLILATRSGAERHATHFGNYFAAALVDPGADLDKNRVVTAEEAFQFAERQVNDYFERNGQLATEHPRLEGGQAGRFSLARLDRPRPVAQSDPRITELSERREALNDDIDGLRLRRDSMSPDDYQSEMLQRLLELATLEEEIEQREAELAGEN